jgi:hypothetical protein
VIEACSAAAERPAGEVKVMAVARVAKNAAITMMAKLAAMAKTSLRIQTSSEVRSIAFTPPKAKSAALSVSSPL